MLLLKRCFFLVLLSIQMKHNIESSAYFICIDQRIGEKKLFKRSITLTNDWCCYEVIFLVLTMVYFLYMTWIYQGYTFSYTPQVFESSMSLTFGIHFSIVVISFFVTLPKFFKINNFPQVRWLSTFLSVLYRFLDYYSKFDQIIRELDCFSCFLIFAF